MHHLRIPHLFLLLSLLAASTASAADPVGTRVPSGSKIFVEAEAGFDAYLTAALTKKKVPVSVVADKSKADFILTGASSHEEKSWSSKIFLGHRDTSEATIKLIDSKSTEVIWAYAVHKKNSARGHQSTAEACAKHLKSIVK